MMIVKLVCALILSIEFVIGMPDVIEDTEGQSTDEDDNIGEIQVTEEVMNPNITINDASDRDEQDELIDTKWDINTAILDVAYYLRAHKFLDYDHRYYSSIDAAVSRLYKDFPKPPLRSLHWEVHRYCDNGFIECLKYLDRTVQLTSLKRLDDTITIMKQNNWNLANNSQQILSIQKDCQTAQRQDNLTFNPFQGPIERFQWRTSASYYMCWFTMLETPELGLFGESCDNHANCLDVYGANNKDPRADDSKPFACAIYSFCPDHCCPMKHLWYMRDCFQSKENPCYRSNRAADRKCSLNRDNNQDFNAIMANGINITCECQSRGYEWSSRFGLCVDINECTRGLHNCSMKDGQTCFNLPGHYDCICQFGMIWNNEIGGCQMSDDFQLLFENNTADVNVSMKKNVVELIVQTLTRSKGGSSCFNYFLIFIMFASTLLLVFENTRFMF